MSRKRKPLPVISGLEITGVAAEGNALGRVDTENGRMVVFVPYAAPGDVADVRLLKKRKSYAEGRIERLIVQSPLRVDPPCNYFGVCGGCRWQHLPYDYQLECKRTQVVDALTRIGAVELPEVLPTLPSPRQYGYRNKMEYTFSNRKWLTAEQLAMDIEYDNRNGAGFHIPGAFDKVLDIENCDLASDLSNRLRNFIRDYALDKGYAFYDLRNGGGLIRTLMVRTLLTGQSMAVVVFGEDDNAAIADVLDSVRERFPELTSLQYAINQKANDSMNDLDVFVHSGTAFIRERMDDLTFRVGPKSFYQTNSAGAEQLYGVARRMTALTGNELVYDLYTGTGTIALYLARHARHVVGIEYVEDAVADARLNALENGIDNAEFYAGDMKNVLTDEFVAQHGRPDVMVVDPPRAGMHPDVVDVILRARPRRIVYVSCNPATQARDLALLDAAYRVTAVQPVDMFPQTQHVESVVCLDAR